MGISIGGNYYYGKNMNLTAQDVYSKEFHVDLKGYAPAEVDEFLDQVIEDYQEYDEKIEELSQAVTRYEQKSMNCKPKLLSLMQITVNCKKRCVMAW